MAYRYLCVNTKPSFANITECFACSLYSLVFGFWRFQLIKGLHNGQLTHAQIFCFSAFAYFTFFTRLHGFARWCFITCIFASHRCLSSYQVGVRLKDCHVCMRYAALCLLFEPPTNGSCRTEKSATSH